MDGEYEMIAEANVCLGEHIHDVLPKLLIRASDSTIRASGSCVIKSQQPFHAVGESQNKNMTQT